MAKRKNAKNEDQNEDQREGTVVDEPRVGVGPHDNITPAQVEQAQKDVDRGMAPASPVPMVEVPNVEEPVNLVDEV